MRNFFIRSSRLRLYEDYGKGGFDPLKNRKGHIYNIKKHTWYDDNGNPVIKKRYFPTTGLIMITTH